MASASDPTRQELPIILVRGFGGLDVADEKALTYYGFNDGTVYPQKRGENYIYEGMILRFLKSAWKYRDATNVVGYYGAAVADSSDRQPELRDLPDEFFVGDKIVVDPRMALALRKRGADPVRSLWVFRYYDLDDRKIEQYGLALKRLIELVRALVTRSAGARQPKVNIIAHSMGGLIVRQALQGAFSTGKAAEAVNKVVTLGTPHQGIAFQLLRDLKWLNLEAGDEIENFNPGFQEDKTNPASFKNLETAFPLDRMMTVIGTNYRTFGAVAATVLNRLSSVDGEFGLNYNRSDGLVKIAKAGIPGAPRAFVHKCHGGRDSLITSREAFEIATRFFHGDIYARLRLMTAKLSRGKDFIGKSEFFIGVSLKPRGVDFDLFHQSKEAENCYGPFNSDKLDDTKVAFDWAGMDRRERLLWEGWLDSGASPEDANDLVIRLETYVSERDLFGIGFSDNIIYHGHCYIQAALLPSLHLASHIAEVFSDAGQPLRRDRDGVWLLPIKGAGFEATFGIELSFVPTTGEKARV